MDAIYYDLGAALPEIFVLVMAMFILLLDLFLKQANRHLIYVFSQLTLFGAAALTFLITRPPLAIPSMACLLATPLLMSPSS